MSVIELKSGRVSLLKHDGTHIRTFVNSGAVFADINSDETLVVITMENGKVELRRHDGTGLRTIMNSGATMARFCGEDILVTTKRGPNELRTIHGTVRRYL